MNDLITDPNAPEVPANHIPYLVRLFQGRLNRKNYGAGSLLLLVFPVICFIYLMGTALTSPATGELLLINPYDPNQIASASNQVTALQATMVSQLDTPLNNVLAGAIVAYFILTLPILLSLQVRRLHDLNHSGWLCLLGFIPVISYFFPLYVAFWSGKMGENKYGMKPISRINITEDILLLGKKPSIPQQPVQQVKPA